MIIFLKVMAWVWVLLFFFGCYHLIADDIRNDGDFGDWCISLGAAAFVSSLVVVPVLAIGSLIFWTFWG